MLHLHDHRRATGDKRAARLGPQPRVLQAETLEACLDFREVCTERRRLHIRITHRETAADIDHLDCHAGIADHLPDQGQRISPGKWLEALRTDMEAEPEAPRMRACRAQQLRRQRRLRAELARQIQHRRPLWHGEADDQSKLTGNTGRSRFIPDLRQLLGAVEHEVPHTVALPRLADGAARLDRVHEMDRGIGEHLTHQSDLADRGAVKMRHAAGVDGTQHRRLRIGFHRVEYIARKHLGEIARGRLDHRRTQAVHRLLGPFGGNQFIDRRQWRCGVGEAAAQRRHRSADTHVVHHEIPRRLGNTDVSPRDNAAATDSDGAARTSHRREPFSEHRQLPNDPGPTLGPARRKGRVTSLLCP